MDGRVLYPGRSDGGVDAQCMKDSGTSNDDVDALFFVQ